MPSTLVAPAAPVLRFYPQVDGAPNVLYAEGTLVDNGVLSAVEASAAANGIALTIGAVSVPVPWEPNAVLTEAVADSRYQIALPGFTVIDGGAPNPATVVIKLRRGLAATWTSANPILAAGEIGVETDTGAEKLGDGTTAWTALAYLFGAGSFMPTSAALTISLQDPTLTGGAADNTGTNYVNVPVNAAIARAKAAAAAGHGLVTITGAPGTYKWNTAAGLLAIPQGVLLGRNGAPGSMKFTFPADTGYPAAFATTSVSTTAGQASVPVTFTRNAFIPATPAAPQIVMMNNVAVTYTGITGSGASVTLTGCTGTPAMGTFGHICQSTVMLGLGGSQRVYTADECVQFVGPNSGTSAWAVPTPPAGFCDGVYVSYNTGIAAGVSGFRMNIVYAGDHETFGGKVYQGNGWCQYACMSPAGINWANTDSGNQTWESGAIDAGGYDWCHHYICSENAIVNGTWQAQTHQGISPWWMWKDVTTGTGAVATMISDCEIDGISFEQVALGVFGCADGKALMTSGTVSNCYASFSRTYPAGYSTAVAPIQCNFQNMTFRNSQLNLAIPANVPMWISDTAYGKFVDGCFSQEVLVAPFATNFPIPITANAPLAWDVVIEDRVRAVTGFNNVITAGDAVHIRSNGGANSNGISSMLHQRATGIAPVRGFAIIAEQNDVVLIADKGAYGAATVNVHVASNPPTAPSAAVSGVTGPAANTYFYKVAHVLSGGGLTAASTEVSVALNGSQGALISWTNAAAPPHSQTVASTRIYRGTAAGAEAGFFTLAGAGTSFTDTGTALTGATSPPTTNVGCELYLGGATSTVTTFGAGDAGKVCIGNTFPIVGTVIQADNGTTGQVALA